MTDKKVVVINEQFPHPLRALATVLEHSRWWAGRPQIPEPDEEDLHRAHNAVAAWLAELEKAHGLSDRETDPPAELHPKQAAIGVCPECHMNDGYQIVGDGVSAVCHRHRVRWEITSREMGSLAQPFPLGPSEADHERLLAYTEVKPVWLAGFAPQPNPPMGNPELEIAILTQGLARTWWSRARTAPHPRFDGRGRTFRFWRPPAHLVAEARRSIRAVERD